MMGVGMARYYADREQARRRARLRLVLSEVFGPTLQGEGPSIGRPAVFLRTGGCDLACSWCDTAYTWDWKGTSDAAKAQGAPFVAGDELHTLDPEQAAAEVLGRLRYGDRLVVSGGEPTLQQPALAATLDLVREAWPRLWVEVETNATREPSPELDALVDRWTCSPKLAHSGDPEHRRLRPEALAAYAANSRSVWKLVVAHPDDLAHVDALVDRYGIGAGAVWVMPLGTTVPKLDAGLAAIADAVVARGYNLTPRLHVTAWGDERGR